MSVRDMLDPGQNVREMLDQINSADVSVKSIPASSVRVETGGYFAAHGRAPRGRGSWAFGPERYTSIDSASMFWVHGKKYSEACEIARAAFGVRGVREIWVQS